MVGSIFWLVIILVLIGLALPPALRQRSWKRFFVGAGFSLAGILFPLFVFVMSVFLVPSWKGAGDSGWLDGFHMGKFALTPLVLWGCVAFYRAQILRPGEKRARLWVVLGLFTGAVVSGVCFGVGLVIHRGQDAAQLWLLVPLYVAFWYGGLGVRKSRESGQGMKPVFLSFFGSLPFWGASLVWTRMHYLSLPDNPPDCFVVTAALRGHKAVVGPLTTIERRGVSRPTNLQLRTFWQFEAIWQERSPHTHKWFRLIYNRLGPRVSRRIRTRLAADLLFVVLKPFEWIAALVVYRGQNRYRQGRYKEPIL